VRISVVLILIALLCIMFTIVAQPALAAPACEWFPSSNCPAPGSTSTSPCYADQIKANWNTMTYHLPGQTSYRAAGAYADVWCFDSEREAINYGFRRAAS
jgi:hypothetical protein